jgi:glycosyltransferase involved in cell wall biosynthesis
MRILLVHNHTLPVQGYGGAERIVWWLGKYLAQIGCEVTYLAPKGTTCHFGKVIFWDKKNPLAAQIPDDIDLVHLHFRTDVSDLPKPHLTTLHQNLLAGTQLPANTVFVSHNHAVRHGGSAYVHNGLDLEDYGEPDLDTQKRSYFHFLGKADWREKNVRGAIDITRQMSERLHVLGGNRTHFGRLLRISLAFNTRFHGMVGGMGKNILINGSKGLIFPVLWHEPFGLAVLESWFFGCPVFGTPYGALPEILGKKIPANATQHGGGTVDAIFSDWGVLSNKKSEIMEAMRHANDFDRQSCHERVRTHFSAEKMARNYLPLYEKILAGYTLHPTDWVVPDDQTGKLLPLRD